MLIRQGRGHFAALQSLVRALNPESLLCRLSSTAKAAIWRLNFVILNIGKLIKRRRDLESHRTAQTLLKNLNVRDGWRDTHIYAILFEEWALRQAEPRPTARRALMAESPMSAGLNG